VRITNCVRTTSWYELAGSVVLSELLGPATAVLAARHPGAVLLAEPGYRTVVATSRACYEGLAVIARDGLRPVLAPGVTPLLAASLTEPGGFTDTAPPPWAQAADPRSWWEAYVRLLVPPVLDLLAGHGVVLEPHLQNVWSASTRPACPCRSSSATWKAPSWCATSTPGCSPTSRPAWPAGSATTASAAGTGCCTA
jgi:siderophore synthetase component